MNRTVRTASGSSPAIPSPALRLFAMLFAVIGPAAGWPPRDPAAAAERWGPPTDIEFRSARDGSAQRYVEMVPEPVDDAHSPRLLVVLHGHGSDRWQYIRQDRGECRGARDVALKYGLILISPDYRAPDSWMGPAAEADVAQIIHEARQRHRRARPNDGASAGDAGRPSGLGDANASADRVILGGGSMGGASALIFAALHPELVAGVVSQNGTANMLEYDHFQDSIQRSYGGTKQEHAAEYRRRSPEFAADRFTMPLAVTTGGLDTLVPPASILRLVDRVKQHNPSILLLHREQGGHNTNYDDTVRAYEFVVQAVQAGPHGSP